MRLSAFDTFVMFMSLKNHFNQEKYDYFKYRGKVKNLKIENFASHSDRFLFQRLSRQYSETEMVDFFVANFIKNKIWIRDFLEEEAKDEYLNYLRRKQSLSYIFTNELDDFFTQEPPEVAFKVGEGHRSLPPILNFIMCGAMSPETFVILDRFIGFSSVLDKKLADDYLWSKYRTLPQKFHPFLSYDKDKMKNILKEKINEYRLPSERHEASRAPQKESLAIQAS
jgi:hypothetical protein